MIAQPDGDVRPGCYAKCLLPENYGIEESVFHVFTGEYYEENDNLEWIELEVPEHSKWEKIHTRWKQIVVPAKTVTLITVLDISLTDEYEVQRYPVKSCRYHKASLEWREVFCDSQVDDYIVREIQQALENLGYLRFGQYYDDNILSPEAKDALVRFQKDFALPIGNLDFETLDALEIRY